jgi:hypothetical protein
MGAGGKGAEIAVTWPQVLAWRMRRQLLAPAKGKKAVEQLDVVEIARRLCGVQAQVPAAAALAVGVRQPKPEAGAVDEALRDGRLMRAWSVRGTLHLLAPDEAGAQMALMAAPRSWEKGVWIKTFGVTPDEMAALTDAVGDVLDGQVLTREQLVEQVAAKLGRADFAEQLKSGWGAVLKPVAWRGQLCHGPPDGGGGGGKVTFGRPDQLLPSWKGVPSPEDAARIVFPTYLRAYGPATLDRIDDWLFRGKTPKKLLRPWLAAVEDELISVDVEGTSAYLLADDADDLAATDADAGDIESLVTLLPGFDQYVLGPGTGATEIIDAKHRKDVSRAGGWISPVVIAGGRVAGTWQLDGTEVDVSLFDDAPKIPAKALAAATTRLGKVRQAVHVTSAA